MTKINLHLVFLFFCSICCLQLNAQIDDQRFEILEQELAAYAAEYPRINKTIDVSVTGTLQEFAIAFSKETKLNLTIDPSIEKSVVTNFADTRPQDILLHLCKFYNLDLTFSGSIISLIPFDEPPVEVDSKEVQATYNAFNDRLELQLKNDTLDYVVSKISQLSKKNVIASKAASNLQVSGFIGQTTFEDALEQLARRNELSITKDEKGYYIFDLVANTAEADPNQALNPGNNPPGRRGQSNRNNNNRGNQGAGAAPVNFQLDVGRDSLGRPTVSVNAIDTPISEIIKGVSERTGNNFFLFSDPAETISISLDNATYEEFLGKILQGSDFGFNKDGNIYLIGDRKLEGLRTTKVYQLQYRSAKDILNLIPTDLSQNVELKEFLDLNSVILSGSANNIAEIIDFFEGIDRPVPVVMIELLILDVQYNRATRAGFEAGLSTEPLPPGGSIFSGLDFTFSANAINRLLGTLAGNGIVNLGQVKPNFYATLQAVEDNGYVVVRSKPRLSSLNGQEANLTVGETRYYLDQRTTLQGTNNPVSVQDRRFQSVTADFSIRIVPVVSGDEHVTLEIEVNQSDFLGQVQNNAPPAQVNRTFTSNIRILNGEMIVLGGLENKTVEDSGTGVPFLSRIPIIKWFFSSRRRAKTKDKLLIFVKPTIIY